MPAALRLTVAFTVVAALLLTACGGGSGTNSTRPANSADAGRGRPPAGELCQSQIGSFIGSMDSLRRRLAVGVTYEQYIDEVHGVGSTYRDVPVGKLQIDCVGAVGIPSEKAFNRYIEAANDWGDCVSEAGCGSAEIEPVLQQRWRIASHLLSEARQGLRQIEG
ncbi:MAG TPA: hypothetical protein VNB59_03375 [Solirubrobacterales bacterium]|nr:hypothetical protein [Solirubrobacterales bacterium]